MAQMVSAQGQTEHRDGIPEPIVKFNRWFIVGTLSLGMLLQQPLLTTLVFLVLAGAVIWGERGSLVARIGRWLFAAKIVGAEREDRRLMRFNNTIAVVMLGLAQLAFVLNAPVVGWAFALMVVIAASVALAGFCVGCFLYFQFKINRTRLFGK